MNLEPGVYEVMSDEPEWLDMQEAAAVGEAFEVYRAHLEGGVVYGRFLVPPEDSGWEENPLMMVAEGFFDPRGTVLSDYTNWRLQWWREVVQNAADPSTRANNIWLSMQEQEDGTWLATCEDDGVGMDRDTLRDAFLTFAGTGKGLGSVDVGGFGDAKKLILGPWLDWKVETRDTRVTGKALFFETYEYTDIPYRKGTKITVRMPADQHTDISAAMEFLQRCSIPGKKVWVDTESDGRFDRWTEWYRLGKKVSEGYYGEVYHNKSKKWGRALVRVNGIYMFDYGGGFDYKVGTLCYELNPPQSKAILASHRTGFRETDPGRVLDRILEEIAVEGQRAVTRAGRKTTLFKEEFTTRQPDPVVLSTDHMTGVRRAMGPVPNVGGRAVKLSKDAMGNVVEALDIERKAEARVLRSRMGVIPEGVAKIVSKVPISGEYAADALAQQLAWVPKMLTRSDDDEEILIQKKLKPDSLTTKTAILAKVWAEACRWVFIQLGRQAKYGVGFIVDDTAGAVYWNGYGRESAPGDWLLLNPYADTSNTKGAILDVSKRSTLKWIYAAAVHEVTHMVDGVHRHDVAFAYALTKNFSEVAEGIQDFYKIAKDVRDNWEPSETREEAAKKKKSTWDEMFPTVDVTVRVDGETGSTQFYWDDHMVIVREVEKGIAHDPTPFAMDSAERERIIDRFGGDASTPRMEVSAEEVGTAGYYGLMSSLESAYNESLGNPFGGEPIPVGAFVLVPVLRQKLAQAYAIYHHLPYGSLSYTVYLSEDDDKEYVLRISDLYGGIVSAMYLRELRWEGLDGSGAVHGAADEGYGFQMIVDALDDSGVGESRDLAKQIFDRTVELSKIDDETRLGNYQMSVASLLAKGKGIFPKTSEEPERDLPETVTIEIVDYVDDDGDPVIDFLFTSEEEHDAIGALARKMIYEHNEEDDPFLDSVNDPSIMGGIAKTGKTCMEEYLKILDVGGEEHIIQMPIKKAAQLFAFLNGYFPGDVEVTLRYSDLFAPLRRKQQSLWCVDADFDNDPLSSVMFDMVDAKNRRQYAYLPRTGKLAYATSDSIAKAADSNNLDSVLGHPVVPREDDGVMSVKVNDAQDLINMMDLVEGEKVFFRDLVDPGDLEANAENLDDPTDGWQVLVWLRFDLGPPGEEGTYTFKFRRPRYTPVHGGLTYEKPQEMRLADTDGDDPGAMAAFTALTDREYIAERNHYTFIPLYAALWLQREADRQRGS
jgi:hypothetical protein